MHSVVHFEIPVSDMARAQKFYADVFGWQMMAYDDKNTMVSTTETDKQGRPLKPGAINGSLYRPEKAATPSVVVDVPDIRAHIEKVKQHGGRLVDEPVTIPGMGMYARFQDLDGNLVGLWQNL
jgi:uncharacterized protein